MPPAMQEPRKVTIEAVVELLRNDRLRGFRIDVETDQLVEADQDAEQQRRMMFVKEVGQLISGALMVEQNPAAPALMPAIGETVMFAVRGMRVGRQLEEVFETAFRKAAWLMEQPKPEGADPKAQAEMARVAFEKQKHEAEHAARLQEIAQNGEIKNMTLAQNGEIKNRELEVQVMLQREKLQNDFELKRADREKDMPATGEAVDADGEPGQAPHEIIFSLLIQQQAEAQARHEELMGHLKAASRPKRILRDENGRVAGVETIPEQE